jgi:hypothetical protein
MEAGAPSVLIVDVVRPSPSAILSPQVNFVQREGVVVLFSWSAAGQPIRSLRRVAVFAFVFGGVAIGLSPKAWAACPGPTITSISPSSGPSGTQVTLTGTFGGSICSGVVYFGSTAATPSSWTNNQITVVSPAGNGTVNVEAVNAFTQPSNSVQFTYTSGGASQLRSMQLSTTPMIAQIWGASVSGAIDGAIGAGFSGNPVSFLPNSNGFTYYFGAPDPAVKQQGNVKDFLASPDGRSRIDDDFAALGYAGAMPTKAPPANGGPGHDWLGWIDVRGNQLNDNATGADLKGTQLDTLAGLSRRVTPDLLIGVFGGYEHFSYSSAAFSGSLSGEGWTAGAYLSWRFAPHLRFDAAGAWSDVLANEFSGTTSGNFMGNRWLTSGGITGTYGWHAFVLEPSARVYAVWEQDNPYTDSTGTAQAGNSFSTGRASGGVKVSYPFAWTTAVDLAPYVGLYGDYYFTGEAAAAGLTTTPLLQGWGARTIGGFAAVFRGGAQLSAGGEYAGIGGNTQIWTWTVRGSVPF